MRRVQSALPARILSSGRRCFTSNDVQSETRTKRSRKRRNYADRESVNTAPHHDQETMLVNEGFSSFADAAAMRSAQLTGTSQRRWVPPASSARLTAEYWWLRALQSSFLGIWTYKLLNRLAVLRYGVGTIRYYTRFSPLGPVGDGLTAQQIGSSGASETSTATQQQQHIRRLAEAGEFAQAAAVATVSASSMESGRSEQEVSEGAESLHGVYRGILQQHALPCVYVGFSKVHGRGLFTRERIPKGTRVLWSPYATLLDPSQYLLLLGDTFTRLPDSQHYTHPTGYIRELVTQARPQFLLNHSCNRSENGNVAVDPRVNLHAGISKRFWPLIEEAAREVDFLEANQAPLRSSESETVGYTPAERRHIRKLDFCVRNIDGFHDPNSFFALSDVEAGEELLIDYSVRCAPMCYGEDSDLVAPAGIGAVVARASAAIRGSRVTSDPTALQHRVTRTSDTQRCACGADTCRGFLYKRDAHVSAFLRRSAQALSTGTPPEQRVYAEDVIKKLLACGYDDELALLSLVPTGCTWRAAPHQSTENLLAYLHTNTTATPHDGMQQRHAKKKDLIMCYRHVFRLLNEAAPETDA